MEGVLSMKKKVLLTIMIALSVAIAGCGSKGKTTESQKEVTIKDTDNKKAENQKKNLEKTTEKSEKSDSKEETIVKEDEKAASQQSTDSNSSDTNNSSNGNTTSNNGSGNTAGNSNSGSTSENYTGNGSSSSSGSTSSGGSSSGSSSNSSNGNSTPASTPIPEPAQPAHTHTWVHVDATGHNETVTIQAAWDEEIPVYENVAYSICNVCGADITGNTTEHTRNHALAYEGGGYHTEWKYEQTGTQIVHHDAITEQRWVQDSPAYDVCSGCGTTK